MAKRSNQLAKLVFSKWLSIPRYTRIFAPASKWSHGEVAQLVRAHDS